MKKQNLTVVVGVIIESSIAGYYFGFVGMTLELAMDSFLMGIFVFWMISRIDWLFDRKG